MIRLILFSTAGCHLCEEAQALLTEYLAAQPQSKHVLTLVDIAEDSQWMDRYGTSIPVARNENSGLELSWPFTAEDLPSLFETRH